MFVVVPDSLHIKIEAMLNSAIAECPAAEPDRAHLYHVLLNWFDEHGQLPNEFRLVPTEAAPATD